MIESKQSAQPSEKIYIHYQKTSPTLMIDTIDFILAS